MHRHNVVQLPFSSGPRGDEGVRSCSVSGLPGMLFQCSLLGAPNQVSFSSPIPCIYLPHLFITPTCRDDPESGNIITFFQFLFVALESGLFVTRFGCKPSHIPIPKYFVLVTFFFVVSVLNNYALSFDVPLPLHMIFRAVSVLSSPHHNDSAV